MSEKATAPYPPTRDGQIARQFDETEALRAQQQAGTAPTIAANRDEQIQIPAHEADRVHVKLVTITPLPGQRENQVRETVESFYPQDYERMNKEGAFAQYDEVHLVHEPSRQTTAPRAAAADKAAPDPADKTADKTADKASDKALTPKQQLAARLTELTGVAPDPRATTDQLAKALADAEAKGAAPADANAANAANAPA